MLMSMQAYTAEEAIADSRILLDARAKLIPGLGPCRNPWGSLLGKKDFGQPRKFYSDNMCLAGGFKGK
jgi:splicing suppressor protein 51